MAIPSKCLRQVWIPRFAALCLLCGAALSGVATQSRVWVIERRGEERAVLGPWWITLCDGDRCIQESYGVRMRRMQRSLRSGLGSEQEREQWRSGIALMRYDRKKSFQLVIPAWGISGVFLLAAGLVLCGGRWSRWTALQGSTAAVAALASLGLLVAALVFADGMSHFPSTGTEVRWGPGFWWAVGAAVSGLMGAALTAWGGDSAEPKP